MFRLKPRNTRFVLWVLVGHYRWSTTIIPFEEIVLSQVKINVMIPGINWSDIHMTSTQLLYMRRQYSGDFCKKLTIPRRETQGFFLWMLSHLSKTCKLHGHHCSGVSLWNEAYSEEDRNCLLVTVIMLWSPNACDLLFFYTSAVTFWLN